MAVSFNFVTERLAVAVVSPRRLTWTRLWRRVSLTMCYALLRAFGFTQSEAIAKIRSVRPDVLFYLIQAILIPLNGT
jgi:hypothetical protein